MISSSKLHKRVKFKQNIPLMILLIPALLYFLLFKYVPMTGLIIIFKDYNLFDGVMHSPWVGWKNFEILFSSPQTLKIIRNTLVLSVLLIVVQFPFPIMVAILLNEVRNLFFKRTVQTMVYLPHFFSWVIVGGIVVTIFAQESGVVNNVLKHWAGDAFPFLYNEVSWISIFLGSAIWKEAGFGAIIYLAAMSSIDPSLYEAAGMDGANKFRQVWHITLPGIRSTVILLLIISMGRVMEVGFDHVYVLQNSAVHNIADVVSTYVYRVGLLGGQFSITAAMGFFESLVGLFLVIVANQIAKRFGQELW